VPESDQTEGGMPYWDVGREHPLTVAACGEDFTSLELFDAHHVGDHALDWPEHEDGRRCLDVDEMTERGWLQDVLGRWLNPARSERAERAFKTAA
jgi:hypothetical protein